MVQFTYFCRGAEHSDLRFKPFTQWKSREKVHED